MTAGASSSILWMLLAALASASLAAVAHALGPFVGWQGVLLSRTFFGLAFAVTAARATRAPIVLFGPRYLWLRSVAGGVGILLGFYAYTKLPVGDVLVLSNTAPIWFAVFSWSRLGHRPSPGEWGALLAGLAGVALVARPHLQQGNLAVVAACFTGITSAIALRALSRLRHAYAPVTILVHHAGAALATAVAVVATVRWRPSLGGLGQAQAAVGILGLGLLGTLGQYAQTRGLASGRAVRAAAASYAGVGFGVVFDHVFWPAPFDPRSAAGMALILLPLAWLIRRPEQGILVVRSAAGHAAGPPPALDPGEIVALEGAIARARGSTSCPIRVHVGGAADGEAGAAAEARFHALGLSGAALGHGVLVYLAPAARQVALAADHGIAEIVPVPELRALCRAAQAELAGAPAGEVLGRAIARLGRLLADYFPARDGDPVEAHGAVTLGGGTERA